MKRWLSIFALSNLFLLTISHVTAQQEMPAEEPLIAAEEMQDLRESLETINSSILKTQEELKTKQAEAARSSNGVPVALEAEITELTQQLDNLRKNFAEIATKEDLDLFESPEETEPLSWDEELKSLFNPLIHSLVKLTSRPREIEALREQRGLLKEQLDAANRGFARLKRLQELLQPEESEAVTSLINAIQEEETEWEKRLTGLNTQITITQQKLDQLLSEKSTLGESFNNLFNLFFKSRGRNLLLAMAGMLLFWLISYRIFLIIQSLRLFQKGRSTFKVRLFNVVYVLVASLGGIFCFLFILFLFGDWLLLTLGALALLGIAWTSKAAIANYWAQMMLLLNLGPVREGERLIFNGLPWIVHRLNFFTILRNPALEGGELRLPISDMPELRSKPFAQSDPWFPTRQEDWILLDDGTHGKVVMQTPDFVRLVKQGNSFKSFPTSDFFGMAPLVLSQGFRCSINFGLDYSDQAGITESIPQTMKESVEKGLIAAGYEPEKTKLNIELAEAGGSSLDLAIIADFDGEYAQDYNKLQRLLSRLCVDACNAYDWNIPFPQLTVHMEKGEA